MNHDCRLDFMEEICGLGVLPGKAFVSCCRDLIGCFFTAAAWLRLVTAVLCLGSRGGWKAAVALATLSGWACSVRLCLSTAEARLRPCLAGRCCCSVRLCLGTAEASLRPRLAGMS